MIMKDISSVIIKTSFDLMKNDNVNKFNMLRGRDI